MIKDRRQRAEFSSERLDSGRLPPHAPEAEQGVLGCVLLAPGEGLGECVAKFGKAGERVFYDGKHQVLYRVLVGMWELDPKGIDVITLQERLQNLGPEGQERGPGGPRPDNLLEQVGGIAYLASLPDVVPSAANLGYYLEIVWDAFRRREMLRVLVLNEGRCYDESADTNQVLDGIEASVLGVAELQAAKVSSSIKELLPGTLDRIEECRRGVGALGGLRTHLGYYDKLTGGLWKGEMIVWGARPSVGKTSLLTTVLTSLSVRERLPVGLFSMEMSEEDIAFRVLCAEGLVNAHKIRTGFIQETDFPKLTSAGLRLTGQAAALLHIDDTPALDILDFRARARRMASRQGVKCIGVDYIQLMHCADFRNNRVQEIGAVANGIKACAKELGIPIIVLSQLNRESAKNRNAKPTIEDLRESGEIEQAADLVGLLYRKPPEKGEDEEEHATDEVQAVNMNVGKQRNGPTGLVEFSFLRWCMRFEDAYQNRGAEPVANPKSESRNPKETEMPSTEEMFPGDKR